MIRAITINNRQIGSGFPTYIVAEMSGNHNGNLDRARELIYAMKESGADAVKLQTYTADTLTIKCERPEFIVSSDALWAGRDLHGLYDEAHTPWEWHGELIDLATSLGMDIFSTPFDHTAVDFLEQFDLPAYKIASYELIDTGLIKKAARTGKPLIMSTGMASIDEISDALEAARETGNEQIVLLKCTSAYPAPPEEANLRTIQDLSQRFNVPAGLSDHTLGIAVPIAAVALGACIVEKHFTMSRSEPGPDNAFSLEPHEFRQMVDQIRIAENALGEVSYQQTKKEAACVAFRRSLYAVEDIAGGEEFTEKNVRSIRPNLGLPPKYFDEIIGKKAKVGIKRGTPMEWKYIEENPKSEIIQNLKFTIQND